MYTNPAYSNPGYGQQQGDPTMQLLQPMYNLQTGQVPAINITMAVPPVLQPLLPQVVYAAINAIQAEAQVNALRMLFFNRMAANGYSNADFTEFVNTLIETIVVIMQAYPQQSQNPQNVIAHMATKYTQYRVARQLQDFPQLQQTTMPQLMQSCQALLAEFNNTMNQALQIVQRQMQPMQPMNYGGVQQRPYTQAGYTGVGMSAVAAVPASQVPQFTGAATPAFTTASFATGQAINSGNWKSQTTAAPATFAPPPVGAPVQTFAAAPKPQETSVKSAPQITSFTGSRPTEVNTQNSNGLTPVHTADDRVSSIEQAMRFPTNPTVAPTAAPEAEPAWEQINQQTAYDPNTYDAETIRNVKGILETRLKERTMERDKHLKLPMRAPHWVKTPTQEQLEERTTKAKNNEPKGKTIELINVNQDDTRAVVMSEQEAWARVRTLLACQRKLSNKIVLTEMETMLIKAMPASSDVRKVIDNIVQSKDYVKAVEYIQKALLVFSEDDQLAIGEANKRLTQEINRFISCEMALPTGTMDSFVDDFVEAQDYITQQYGPICTATLLAHTAAIFNKALSYVDPDSDAYKNIKQLCVNEEEAEVDEQKAEAINDVEFLIFTDALLLTAVDLNSAELKLELPESKAAVFLMQSAAPFAYEIINTVLQSKVYEGSDWVLLSTNDGIILQIDRGAFNEDAIMVSQSKRVN